MTVCSKENMQKEVINEVNILSKDVRNYADLQQQIATIRSKLFLYILNYPDNKTKFAAEIGVSAQTLSRFLEEKKIDFISLSKIRLFVIRTRL